MEQNEIDQKIARELREKYFNEDLKKSDQKKSLEYHQLLFAEQKRLLKENNGIVTVPIERREELFRQAGTNITIGRVDRKHMEERWSSNISLDGRPPIGGAQDD